MCLWMVYLFTILENKISIEPKKISETINQFVLDLHALTSR